MFSRFPAQLYSRLAKRSKHLISLLHEPTDGVETSNSLKTSEDHALPQSNSRAEQRVSIAAKHKHVSERSHASQRCTLSIVGLSRRTGGIKVGFAVIQKNICSATATSLVAFFLSVEKIKEAPFEAVVRQAYLKAVMASSNSLQSA